MKSEIDRREFIKLTAGAGIATAFPQATAPGPDSAERDLVMLALDAVRSAGASYADVRITRGNIEAIGTRERQITNVVKNETYGIGIRAIVGGSWGFAATRDLSCSGRRHCRAKPDWLAVCLTLSSHPVLSRATCASIFFAASPYI